MRWREKASSVRQEYLRLKLRRFRLPLVVEVKNIITENAVKNKSLLHAGRDIDTQAMLKTWGSKLDLLQITDSSTVILRGGREGQMLVLIPSLQQGQVIWQCVGGSQHAMPKPCR